MRESRSGRRRRWTAFVLAGAVLGVALGTVVSWAGYTYLAIVEMQVEIADATSRLEAACQGRAALVANLLDTVEEEKGPDTTVCLERIARAAERARDTVLTRPVHRHPGQASAVEEAQQELSAALVEFWELPAARGAADTAVGALDDLEGRIVRSERQLRDALDRLDRSLETYDRALHTFPASLLMGAGGERADASLVGRAPR